MTWEICGKSHNIDRCHVIPRRMRGEKDIAMPTEKGLINLCRNCDSNIYEGEWVLKRCRTLLRVLVSWTGHVVSANESPSLGDDDHRS